MVRKKVTQFITSPELGCYVKPKLQLLNEKNVAKNVKMRDNALRTEGDLATFFYLNVRRTANIYRCKQTFVLPATSLQKLNEKYKIRK